MNRPRESLLTMFDPLFGSVSQQNGGDSSVELDDYDSEKENNMPLGDVTMISFFNGALKPKACPQPAPLKRRLVDIGDVTVDSTLLMNEVLEEIGEDEESEDENSTIILGPIGKTPMAPSSVEIVATPRLNPRAPFAELRMEREVTPVAHKRLLTRQKQHTNPTTANDSAAQPHSSLSSLIDAVTSAGVSFAGSKPTLSEAWPNVVPVSPKVSEVTIISPFQTSPTNIPLPSSPIDVSELDAPTPRPRKPPPSVRDHDRRSLDLHASFQLQFGSAESSFDLLTDKISFLCSRSHDFDITSGDEDENVNMKNVLVSAGGDDIVNVAANIPLPSQDSPEIRHIYSATHVQSPNTTDSPLPVFTPKSYTPTQAMVPEDLPQDDEVFPSTRDPLVTPAPSKSLHPVVPPPIQALRIVKRTKNAAAAAPPPDRRLSRRPPAHNEKKTSLPIQSDIPNSAQIGESEHHAPVVAPHKPVSSGSSSGPRRVLLAESKEVPRKAGGVGHMPKNNRPKKVLLSDAVAQWGHMQPAKAADLNAVRDALKAIGTGKPKAPARDVKCVVRPSVNAHVGQKESRPASTIPRPVSSTSRLPAPVFGTNRAGAAAGKVAKPGVGLLRRVGTGL
ncbi:uncharacterized protein EV420DRAFT_830235 [Desarmillaria tabescens]|uniref:Uncharacterized protein n=1 Tax=Armillaria tabescens TaxID=1929756 RepID=A0AA39NIX2_ARMTA|nr:uncharacterized protein EV420DRAFT_830235 [Desarmillaria tabescens]KAK0466430.1 hypothetical protein EV420DRAFT_830235 [Desarmillaria tabescens]